MAEYRVEVPVYRTARLTVQVRVEAENRTNAEAQARAMVRRTLESPVGSLTIVHASAPTYQVMQEVISSEVGEGAA